MRLEELLNWRLTAIIVGCAFLLYIIDRGCSWLIERRRGWTEAHRRIARWLSRLLAVVLVGAVGLYAAMLVVFV